MLSVSAKEISTFIHNITKNNVLHKIIIRFISLITWEITLPNQTTAFRSVILTFLSIRILVHAVIDDLNNSLSEAMHNTYTNYMLPVAKVYSNYRFECFDLLWYHHPLHRRYHYYLKLAAFLSQFHLIEKIII